ncbi:U-box domain-containing protein 21-like [Salvia miltiorrhiza]|uniref:U-box domain-containing protein 21-like n=1 Tax=Salvia miltiorrhiza TaxID=226208 RepID=UPI0025ACA9B0|nr:U-box domain-containing protein 21-like [Salvia miltiorrhiza]
MTFSWRRRRGKIAAAKAIGQEMELTIPSHFRCPISLDLMKDPVTLSTGITYDRDSIEKWIEAGKVTCPVTNQVLRNFDQIPNHSIRKMIQDWCVANKSYGVERIPTPRIPISRYEVSEICARMEAAARCGDARKLQELLVKTKNSAKESEHNKRCIVANGVGSALAESFESFARFSVEENEDLIKEILSALTWTFPADRDGVSRLKSAVSLRCMARLLKAEDDLSSRQNAVCVLRDLVSADQGCIDGLMGIEGVEEALFQIVKVPICPKATKASLVVINYMISSADKGEKAALRFVQMGLISLILEVLVDGDKSVCEKALGVMDTICSCKQGRESANENALTVPLLVKKILRVSDVATELAISTLWKLCMGENESALVEAVQLGAFQKLLVVLQIGSGERIKDKVTDLLKLMNLYRDKLDCFDSSMGFKYIKRSN